MNSEMKMTHTLRILLSVFATVVVLGGGFLGWIYYSNGLTTKQGSTVKTAPAKKPNANQAEITAIQGEIQKSDDIDISDLDNTADLDKIDLSGI